MNKVIILVVGGVPLRVFEDSTLGRTAAEAAFHANCGAVGGAHPPVWWEKEGRIALMAWQGDPEMVELYRLLAEGG